MYRYPSLDVSDRCDTPAGTTTTSPDETSTSTPPVPSSPSDGFGRPRTKRDSPWMIARMRNEHELNVGSCRAYRSIHECWDGNARRLWLPIHPAISVQGRYKVYYKLTRFSQPWLSHSACADSRSCGVGRTLR
jgi:hypothetical protein